MARIRTIKPEIFTDEVTGALSDRAFKLLAGLLTLADDYGVLVYSLPEFRAKIFPYEPGHPQDVIGKAMTDLLASGRVVAFTVQNDGDGPARQYLWIRNFLRHQKVDKPSLPLLKGWERGTTPENYGFMQESLAFGEGPLPDHSPTTPRPLSLGREGKGREGKGETPPSAAAQIDPVFENFWQTYPSRRGKKLEKQKAVTAFQRLSEAERGRAVIGVSHYRATCDKGELAKDAHRWLRDHCFDEWQKPADLTGKPNANGQTHPEPPGGAGRRRGWNASQESYDEYMSRSL